MALYTCSQGDLATLNSYTASAHPAAGKSADGKTHIVTSSESNINSSGGVGTTPYGPTVPVVYGPPAPVSNTSDGAAQRAQQRVENSQAETTQPSTTSYSLSGSGYDPSAILQEQQRTANGGFTDRELEYMRAVEAGQEPGPDLNPDPGPSPSPSLNQYSGSTAPVDTRTQAEKESAFYQALSDAQAAAKNGDPTLLRNFDTFFGITRPAIEYTKDFYMSQNGLTAETNNIISNVFESYDANNDGITTEAEHLAKGDAESWGQYTDAQREGGLTRAEWGELVQNRINSGMYNADFTKGTLGLAVDNLMGGTGHNRIWTVSEVESALNSAGLEKLVLPNDIKADGKISEQELAEFLNTQKAVNNITINQNNGIDMSNGIQAVIDPSTTATPAVSEMQALYDKLKPYGFSVNETGEVTFTNTDGLSQSQIDEFNALITQTTTLAPEQLEELSRIVHADPSNLAPRQVSGFNVDEAYAQMQNLGMSITASGELVTSSGENIGDDLLAQFDIGPEERRLLIERFQEDGGQLAPEPGDALPANELSASENSEGGSVSDMTENDGTEVEVSVSRSDDTTSDIIDTDRSVMDSTNSSNSDGNDVSSEGSPVVSENGLPGRSGDVASSITNDSALDARRAAIESRLESIAAQRKPWTDGATSVTRDNGSIVPPPIVSGGASQNGTPTFP